MSELSSASLYSRVNIIDNAFFGVNAQVLGQDLYNEFSLNTSFAYDFKNFFIGVSCEYDRIKIKNFSNEARLIANIGGIVRINEYLTSGFSLKNLRGRGFGGDSESALRQGFFGVGINVDESFKCGVDAIINFEHNSGLALSAKYIILNLISVKAAFLTNPRIMDFGVSLRAFGGFNLYSYLSYHDELGFDKKLGLEFNF